MSKLRMKKALKTENRIRVALYYTFQLLVDVIIVLICIKAFSASYNFAHDVFVDSAKNLNDKDFVVVKIAPDSSTSPFVMMPWIRFNSLIEYGSISGSSPYAA